MSRQVSPALQELVANNEHIKEVHFDARGDYHLNAFDEELPIINTATGKAIVNAKGEVTKKKTGKRVAGGGKRYIVDTLSREQILSANSTSVAVDGQKKDDDDEEE